MRLIEPVDAMQSLRPAMINPPKPPRIVGTLTAYEGARKLCCEDAVVHDAAIKPI
jgi:hypothetical protein